MDGLRRMVNDVTSSDSEVLRPQIAYDTFEIKGKGIKYAIRAQILDQIGFLPGHEVSIAN